MAKHNDSPSVVWFREDLRLADNPALTAAKERGNPVLCVYVCETDETLRPHGGASRWWLHHSLAALGADLDALGGRLDLLHGPSEELIPKLVASCDAGALFFNRRYGEAAVRHDERIAEQVGHHCEIHSFNGRLLHEPWEIKTKQGSNYGVYTPYWRAALAEAPPAPPLPRPRKIEAAPYPTKGPSRVDLGELRLLPTKPDWSGGLAETWQPGEKGAHERLKHFLKNDLQAYATNRNILFSKGTSHLSPHLRFGEISPRTIYAAVKEAETKASAEDARTFLSEIGWREFDYHVLHFHPDVATKNLHARFDKMGWGQPKAAELRAWQRGQTGYPVVDAGMRQLWQTGYMHNRVRMITASFFIKHLLCDWRIGEEWFWDCLCDADPANNPMNWQWVAGSGADAAPFFRIFNPVTQGQKFDPDGAYVRHWVPELAKLKGKAIHAPWETDAATLSAAGITLGKTYPHPIVEHKMARERALKAYEKVKG
jgi:deoxyribodipyrimidine photo-lyase